MGDKVELSGCLSPGARRGWACLTLGAEGLPTEVALERLLAGVCAQVHVEVGLLGEGMAAELTDIRPFIPGQMGTQSRGHHCGDAIPGHGNKQQGLGSQQGIPPFPEAKDKSLL